jgi:hypothetical protein
MPANVQGFAGMLAETAPHVINPPKMITNIPDYSNYETLYYMFLGRAMADVVRAGSDIRKRVKFKASSKVGWYNVISDDHEPQMSNDGTWLIAYWCAHMAQESWKREELLINAGGVTEGSIAEETWVQELHSKLQSLEIQLMSSWAESFWSQPNFAEMGGNDPLRPYSIPVYLNQMANGLWNPGSAGVGGTFTEIHGINPAASAYSKYKPYTAAYGGAGSTGFTPGDKDSVIRWLSAAMRKTSFKPPPVGKEYWDNPEETDIDRSGGFIACSEPGLSRLENLYRASQTEWANWMDPSGQPQFRRVPLVYEAQLDNALLYPISTTGTGTEATATFTGPRYYGVNAKRMHMFWHKNAFLDFLDPFRESATMYTQHVLSMGAMFCEDRSKHFMLYPQASH